MECQVCGNDYDKPLVIEYEGDEYVFDCFECAIDELAPDCDNCGVRIIGHGNEVDDQMYCCANCAQAAGYTEIRDRV